MATSMTPPAVRVRAPTGPRATTDSPAPSEIEALPSFPPGQTQPAMFAPERTPSPGPVPVPITVQKQNHGKPTAGASEGGAEQQAPAPTLTPRRSSFSFLKRGKSVERLNSTRSVSGSKKLTKKQQKEREAQAQREAAMLPKEPPKLPAPPQSAPLQTFGGEGAPDKKHKAPGHPQQYGFRSQISADSFHRPPVPPLPGTHKGAFVDPYSRSESMTNRGRYSYASSTASTLNSPRRIRRRKDPTPFNVLVIGAKNSGKTSFIEFLRTALALPARKQPSKRDEYAPELNQKSLTRAFEYHFLETELSDGERVGLTIWDSEGLEKNVIDLQLREVSAFVESKFEETLNEEMKVVRSPGARDTHIHAVFLLLDPVQLQAKLSSAQKARQTQQNGQSSTSRSAGVSKLSHQEILGSLDEEIDLQILRTLQGKTTVIPVISKADTVPQDFMVDLKRSVGESLRQASLDPLESLKLEDDDDEEDSESSEDEAERKRALHRRHDSKKFDERDEDRLLGEQAAQDDDRSNLSVLDLSSSSSSTSVAQESTQKTGKADAKSTGEANLFLPLSIISPFPIVEHEPGPGHVGRKFAWGFADPYEPEHCDFVRLKQAVFREWRDELREASRELWYERWRTMRLNRTGDGSGKQPRASAGRAYRNGAGTQSSGSNTRTTQWPLNN